MSDTVKLIIEIPKPMYESIQNGTYCGTLYEELKNGIPLDVKSENMRMIKEKILHHFQDINFYYNDCMMYADLSGMLDELIAESEDKE